jgi:predicted DNA-binding protein (MmcQ/YjbR family)
MAKRVKAGRKRGAVKSVTSQGGTRAAELPGIDGRLADFCRGLAGTTEDIKWWEHLVFSVGGKMFASFTIDEPGRFGFKCDEDDFDRLTAIPGIIPAPYAARFGWVTFERRGVLRAAELRRLLRKSHGIVVRALPARVQREIEQTAGRGERRT